jgi:tellurite resistance protein TerC
MIWIWALFITFVLSMLALDLGVFHRKAHTVGVREAIAWSIVWLSLGVVFGIFVYFGYENKWFDLGLSPDAVDGLTNNGATAVEKYLTGYIVEKSLSVDNIFVIAMIFSFFAVPAIYQHRVLFWGIIGALLMRGFLILIGAKLIAKYHWVLYIFAIFLILTALKMLFLKTENTDLNRNFVLRLTRRFLPVTARYHGDHFIVRAGASESYESELPGEVAIKDEVVENQPSGRLMLTPLALALAMVETTDLIFAVDSIPAIFAITADPFLVFTSNVFAILGLRSLYFVLIGMVQKFRYIKLSLALILLVVGIKMLFVEWLKLALGRYFNFYLLMLVLFILFAGVAGSLVADHFNKRKI